MSALEKLVGVLDQYDADLKFETGTMSAWSGQLRMTLTNPDSKPSRSVTFFIAGAQSPEDAAEDLLADFEQWHAESGIEPMPVPEWMLDR